MFSDSSVVHRLPAKQVLYFMYWYQFVSQTINVLGVARGCTCTSAGRRKYFRLNLQGKFVSALPSTLSAPQAEQKYIFMTFFAGR